MSEISDKILTTCPRCKQTMSEEVVRDRVSVKLNGDGGQWPNETLEQNDVVHAYFSKNDGNAAEVRDTYRIARNARDGYRIVAYCQLILREEPIE